VLLYHNNNKKTASDMGQTRLSDTANQYFYYVLISVISRL